jgi:putative copper export protein
LGMIGALWEVSYGRMLLVKLLLVIPLVAFGASNHYTTVPLLRRWSARPGPRRARWRILVVIQRRATGPGRLRVVGLIRRFARKVRAEVILVVGILICTALLLHGAPARHAMHREHTLMPPQAPSRAVGKPMGPVSFR